MLCNEVCRSGIFPVCFRARLDSLACSPRHTSAPDHSIAKPSRMGPDLVTSFFAKSYFSAVELSYLFFS